VGPSKKTLCYIDGLFFQSTSRNSPRWHLRRISARSSQIKHATMAARQFNMNSPPFTGIRQRATPTNGEQRMMSMRQNLLRVISFTVGSLAVPPAAFALDRATTTTFCTDAIYAICGVSRKNDEPDEPVRIRCRAYPDDHSSKLLAVSRHAFALNPEEAIRLIPNRLRPVPSRHSHPYCLKLGGTAPCSGSAYSRARRTPAACQDAGSPVTGDSPDAPTT